MLLNDIFLFILSLYLSFLRCGTGTNDFMFCICVSCRPIIINLCVPCQPTIINQCVPCRPITTNQCVRWRPIIIRIHRNRKPNQHNMRSRQRNAVVRHSRNDSSGLQANGNTTSCTPRKHQKKPKRCRLHQPNKRIRNKNRQFCSNTVHHKCQHPLWLLVIITAIYICAVLCAYIVSM